MSTQTGYVSAGEIISDVTSICNDEGFDELSEGFYMSQVQQALTELGLDTFFDRHIWTHSVPPLTIKLPLGMVSIKNLYAFNGNVCSVGNRADIHFARNYVRYGGASMKEQQGTQRDPIMENVLSSSEVAQTLYYNTFDGHLMLSDAVAGYEKVYMEYSGIGVEFGDAPVIHHWARKAVKDWAAVECLRVLVARDKGKWADAYLMAKEALWGGRAFNDVGSWKQAHRRAQNVDQKERSDFAKYLGTFGRPVT